MKMQDQKVKPLLKRGRLTDPLRKGSWGMKTASNERHLTTSMLLAFCLYFKTIKYFLNHIKAESSSCFQLLNTSKYF